MVYRVFITYSVQARTGHDHRLCLAIDLMSDLPGKMLDHDSHFFSDSLLMAVNKRFQQQGSFGTIIMWIGLNLLEETPVGSVGSVVLKHIKDEMLIYRLSHRI